MSHVLGLVIRMESGIGLLDENSASTDTIDGFEVWLLPQMRHPF